MGKQAPKLIVATLIVAALVILAWQNLTPTLALNFLGFQSVTLPLGVWLTAAIALGALTTITIATLADIKLAPANRSNRRRWNVKSDVPPHPDAGRSPDGTTQQRNRGWNVRSPQDFFRRNATNRDDRRQAPRNEPRPRSRPGSPPPSNAVAAEDWQVWGQRNKPSAWQEWSDASGNQPGAENFDRRQRRDRDKAEATIHDLDKGWDDSARDTVYVPPGGSEVQDTLDEIEDGWEDWDSPDNPLADTAYAQKI
ncbi:MAG: LapA family protein [Leptolyngbya sp. SIOISBB]|nr:LapA family protein [Leptolyngbya sp. SIOISBB]